jgi:hypothetical protein
MASGGGTLSRRTLRLTHGEGTLGLRTSSTTNTRGDRGLVAWSEE